LPARGGAQAIRSFRREGWEAAIEHIVGLMREGIPINGPVARDEMHRWK
jgi:hypothetical protein